MASGFQSRQHKRRLVDEWPLEAAYRRMREVVAAGLRAMDAEMRAIRESERVEMVGGTGGPPHDEMRPENGMHVEQCSNCDGVGSYEYRGADGSEYPAQCDACHGTGRITYRTAAQAQRDSTLEMVWRQRDALAAQPVVTFTSDEQARLNVIRSLYRAGHYGEDR